ncbi:MAG: 50S ribosomal protein L15 [Patescibacteria group bacterium]|jgi:large subunit ribosomal protein L15
MTITLSNLKAPKKKQSKRRGRGNGSGRGNYSTRGVKGQRSRSGGRKNLRRRGLKQMLQQIPKSRGFKSFFPNFMIVNLQDLEKKFDDGELITPKKLHAKKLVPASNAGIKILGNTVLKKKFTLNVNAVSKAAETAIKKAGGSIQLIPLIVKNIKKTHKKE